MFDKKEKIFIIVESPEKARTITKIFKDAGYPNVKVQATIGHFTRIADGSGYWNTGIDPDNNFSLDYKIDINKKDNVSKLKDAIKNSDFVYIGSDGDREGEAIAWSCLKFLNIPKSKYKRIAYHEINKRAIFEAIENARDIDYDLVNAAHSRAVLDKMVGYRLSPVARTSVNCKSVGRCQSAALKLIVQREEEIQNFKPEHYIDLFLHFEKNGTEFKARYQGTDDKPVKQLKSQKEVENIVNICKGNPFVVRNVENKEKKDYPKAPFCTSSFQQEVTSKLGLTTKEASDCAQKLFDGLNINGEQVSLITYMRTDDSTYSPEFEKELKEFVLNKFGKKYVGVIKKGKKDENAQEGHEALRCTRLDLEPSYIAKFVKNDVLNKIYRIIYNRTVASCLAPAIVSETTYNIYNNDQKFTLISNELIFEGYRKVYNYKSEDSAKEDIVKETFEKNETLTKCSLEAVPNETKPKPRFKEATLLKELQDKGIGRPSTYANIVETVLSESRGYCTVDKKNIIPTEKGITLSHFLDKSFPDIINLEYTKEMEKSLDLIANGKLNYLDFLKDFYSNLEESAKKASPVSQKIDKKCPKCGGELVIRKGKFSPFLGCKNYPKCTYTESLKKK